MDNDDSKKIISANCRNCGGRIDIDETKETAVCEFCGTKYSVDDLINESDEISLLVKSALESPYNKIIDNSGNNGINTENIIDSYKVVVEEINNSFSIACMLLTTSSLIINNMNNYSKIDIDKIM